MILHFVAVVNLISSKPQMNMQAGLHCSDMFLQLCAM